MDCVSESHVIVIFQDMRVDFKLCQTQRQGVSTAGPAAWLLAAPHRGPHSEPLSRCSSRVPCGQMALWGSIHPTLVCDHLIPGFTTFHPPTVPWVWLVCSEPISSYLYICLIHRVQWCYAWKHHLGLGCLVCILCFHLNIFDVCSFCHDLGRTCSIPCLQK